MQRRLGDARRGEALFLVALSMIAIGLLLAQFLAWMWFQSAILADPTGPTAIAFWLSQVGALMLCLFTCVVGFTPTVVITMTPTALHLRRGKHERMLRYDEITSVASLSARRYYQHFGRYAATDAFVNRLTPEVLLLHTLDGPVGLGLPSEHHDAVRHHLEDHLAPPVERPVARVA